MPSYRAVALTVADRRLKLAPGLLKQRWAHAWTERGCEKELLKAPKRVGWLGFKNQKSCDGVADADVDTSSGSEEEDDGRAAGRERILKMRSGQRMRRFLDTPSPGRMSPPTGALGKSTTDNARRLGCCINDGGANDKSYSLNP